MAREQMSKGLGVRRSAARRGNGNRLGAAVTEFAIVAPIFLLLIIGIIELARALMVQQVLINASRVGARQATMGATSTTVEAAVAEYAMGVAVPGVAVEVAPEPSTATPGTAITVTTGVDFGQVSWLPAPWFLNGVTLSAQSTMRREGFD